AKKPRRQRRGFPCVPVGKGQTKPTVPAHRRRHECRTSQKRCHSKKGRTAVARPSSQALPSQPLTLVSEGKEWRTIGSALPSRRFCQDHCVRLIVSFPHRRAMYAGPTQGLDQHPFVMRLLQHIDLSVDDLKSFE